MKHLARHASASIATLTLLLTITLAAVLAHAAPPAVLATTASVTTLPVANGAAVTVSDAVKLSRADCVKAKLAGPRRVFCDDSTNNSTVAQPAKPTTPSNIIAAAPPVALPVIPVPAAPPIAMVAKPEAAQQLVPHVEKRARITTNIMPSTEPTLMPLSTLTPVPASGTLLTAPLTGAATTARPVVAPQIAAGNPPSAVINAPPLSMVNVGRPTLLSASNLALAEPVKLLVASTSGSPPINPSNNPKLPATKPPVAFEAAQLVIYWNSAGEAAIGMTVMAREFKLNPASENPLPNLGGVIATFKVASQRETERVKTLLTARYPTWRIDFHARYLPHQSGAPQALLSRPKPRQFLAEKINYTSPALDAGAGIRVGIVDTAVELNAALKANAVVQRSFLSMGEIPAATAHGTALAALIAGHDAANDFTGVSPSAVLYVAGIMRLQGGGAGGSAGGSNNAGASSNTATLVRALDWLLGERVQVVNLSLGGSGDRVMEEVIARLLRANVVVVSAVGNQGEDAAPSYPAAYPGVIAVTASDANDRIFTQANRGAYVTVTAPGVDVWTPDNRGGHYVTGTSFAAAVVSGAVAVMLWRDARLDAASIRQRLCQHARDLSSGSSGASATFGCGLIQLQPTLVALPKRGAASGSAS